MGSTQEFDVIIIGAGPAGLSAACTASGLNLKTLLLEKSSGSDNHPLSEDMLLGLGAGMGFIYWKMKMGPSDYVFVGGRGNNKGFFNDLGDRTGVKIDAVSTTSVKKAEVSLLQKLARKEPVMLFGDMGFLPWFSFPQEAAVTILKQKISMRRSGKQASPS